MSIWYWVLWALLTVLNGVLWLTTWRNLEQTRALLAEKEDA